MKKIIILSNHHSYTYNFRKEIIERLIDENYKVYVVLPYGEKVELLKEMGCEFIDLPLDRRGMNPFVDFKLIIKYYKIISKIKPDAVLSYTIKPNIYGGIVTKLKKVPFYPNITGLGSAVENKSVIQKFIISLYRLSLNKSTSIFFQNKENQDFFINHIFKPEKYKLIPGSGVNLEHFKVMDYLSDDIISFVFISRIMKEKGIDQYLAAAKYINNRYTNIEFHICGFLEDDYEEIINEYEELGIIKYHGMVGDIREILKDIHCTIHPTYYPEGMSNVLLESLASGRPIITTNRSGTREIVEEGVNGFMIEAKNTKQLISAIEKFINLSYEEKKELGLMGRKTVERQFDRKIVTNAYLEEIKKNSKYKNRKI